MNESELRSRCATLALGGLQQQPAGTWTLSETALARIREELRRAAAVLPQMLETFGLFAMWIPSYRRGSEPARDALLRLLADWQPETAPLPSPRAETLGRFSRRAAAPPSGSRKALPGLQFSFDETLGGSGR